MQISGLNGWQALLITLFFGVTGYIAHSVAVRFTPRRSERIELLLLRFLAYGTANAFVAFYLVLQKTKFSPNLSWHAFIMDNAVNYFFLAFEILFIVPACLGLIVGLVNLMYGWHVWYRGYATWDEKLLRTRDQWLLITLSDGNKVFGLFDGRSAVFTESTDKDLFLGQVYKPDENGAWQKVPRTRGMLIRGSTIQHIEFWSGWPERETKGVFRRYERFKVRMAANIIPTTPPNCDSSIVAPQEKALDADNRAQDKTVEENQSFVERWFRRWSK